MQKKMMPPCKTPLNLVCVAALAVQAFDMTDVNMEFAANCKQHLSITGGLYAFYK